MRSNGRKLLTLIEQQPRSVRELADITQMKSCAVYKALRMLKKMGIVASKPRPPQADSGRPPHIFGLAHVDLSAYV